MDSNRQKHSILIVDDEPQIGKIFGLGLKLAGFNVTSTTSGAEAVELIRKCCYDIMLLDIFMTEMTGFEVLEKVRSFSQIPIIVFTARQDVFDIAKQAGANDFIGKPLNPDKLVDKIREFLQNNEKN